MPYVKSPCPYACPCTMCIGGTRNSDPCIVDIFVPDDWPADQIPTHRLYWCNAHQRRATHYAKHGMRKGSPCCDPKLPGITLPCDCVDLTGIAIIQEGWNNGWVCDLGDGTFDHDWEWIHDFEGDYGVPNGTRDFHYRICRVCGEEDHKTPYEYEPLDDDVL